MAAFDGNGCADVQDDGHDYRNGDGHGDANLYNAHRGNPPKKNISNLLASFGMTLKCKQPPNKRNSGRDRTDHPNISKGFLYIFGGLRSYTKHWLEWQ